MRSFPLIFVYLGVLFTVIFYAFVNIYGLLFRNWIVITAFLAKQLIVLIFNFYPLIRKKYQYQNRVPFLNWKHLVPNAFFNIVPLMKCIYQ